MPYVEDREDYDIFNFGYVNSETFEIVIPAQYQYASAFIGNFAAVRKQDKNFPNKKRDKYFVINKKNEVVIENIDDVRILEAEDSKIIYALTENYSGSKSYTLDSGWNAYTRTYPEKTTYRLFDLNTGKIVFEATDSYREDSDNHIRFFADYMIFGDGLSSEYIYKMENDGMYKKISIEEEYIKNREKNIELITRIAREKNLEKVLHFNIDTIDGYDWNIADINLDLLLKNLPENMRIWLSNDIWEKANDDWIDLLKKSYEEISEDGYKNSKMRLVNKERVNPFREKDYLFSIALITKDQKIYGGLYNASKNQWAIPPIEDSDFYMSEYDDWVSTGRPSNNTGDIRYVFYNIKTREKNKYLYAMFYERSVDEGTMTYLGHYKDLDHEKIIEKF
jgi:hypothetical protein